MSKTNIPNYQQNIKNDEIDFSSFIRILNRNKKLILFLISLLSTISLTFNLTRKPIYKGSFNILIKEAKTETTFNPLALINPINNSKTNETQKVILKSPSVLLPVFESVKTYYKNKSIDIEDYNFNDWVKDLTIDFEKGTNVLKVTAFNKDKDLIIYTLKNISSKYKEYSKELKVIDIKKNIRFLETEIESLEKRAINSQKKFNKFFIENGLGPINGIINLETKLDFSLTEKDSKNDSQNKNYLNENSYSQRFDNQYALLKKLEARYIDLSSKLKNDSKTLINLKREIKTLKEYLRRPNEILINFQILKEKASRDTGLLYAAERELAIAKLNLNNTPNAWDMISSPTLDKQKAYPKTLKNVLFSFFASIVFSIFISIIKDRRDDLKFDLSDFEPYLEISYLGTIYKNSKLINTNLLDKVLNKENLINSNIGLILFDKSNNKEIHNEIFFEKRKNLIHTNLLEDKIINKTDKLILIFESGKFNSNDLKFINNYIDKYNQKLVGWFLLTSNNQLINKNISYMMNSSNS
tara:strand:+ start:465 stop:2042 length:1578 start_codon:yes stop_codon:yes gene_type:complete